MYNMDEIKYTPNLDKAKEILTYSDFFRKEDMPDLQTEIKKLNLHKSISIICELVSVIDVKHEFNVYSYNISINLYQVILKQWVRKTKSEEDMFSDPIFHSNRFIISRQVLLMLLKDFIVYGNYDSLLETDYTITEQDYKKIVILNLIEAERLSTIQEELSDSDNFLYANYHFNYKKNLAAELARMHYIMEKNKSVDYFSEHIQGEYVNYYYAFEQKYGFAPTEYLVYLFLQAAPYFNDPKLHYASIWKNVDNNQYEDLKKECIYKILDTISFKVKQYREWAIESEKREWDFSLFFSYPFIKDEENHFLSISDVTTINAYFERLFWLIRDCFPREDSRSMAFFGRLFEVYIQELTNSSVEKEYTFINEFDYNFRGQRKFSSDAYIKKDKNLLVVEAKGFSVLQNVLIKNESVEENYKKLFVTPVLQADKALSEIEKIDSRFYEVEEAFIISVTMDSIGAVPGYLSRAHKLIDEKKRSKKTKYYFNFSIEEYEILMFLLEQEMDIFEVLKQYFCTCELPMFSDFISGMDIEIKMPTFTKELYEQYVEKLSKYLIHE